MTFLNYRRPTLEKALDSLVKARELISEPNRWTQGCYARDASREGVLSSHPDAVCFCSLGALKRVYPQSEGIRPGLHEWHDSVAAEALHYWLAQNVPNESPDVPEFNDSRTHAEVLGMFDGTIEMVEGLING